MRSYNASERIPDFELFQTHQISVPLERTKYLFMSMFLSRALNLKDESSILDPASYKAKTHVSLVEILPHIAIPSDLWLLSEIGIPHLKVKVALLKDINAMLARVLDSLNNGEYFMLDDHLLRSFETRVAEYRMTELSPDFTAVQSEEPQIEDTSELDHVSELSLSIKDYPADTDTMSVSSASTRTGSMSKNSNRMSTFSRDLLLGKRKLSIFGLNQHLKPVLLPPNEDRVSGNPGRTLQISPETPPSEPSNTHQFVTQKSSQMNGLLLKSKFYNKLVKRRDLEVADPASLSASSTPSYLSLVGAPGQGDTDGYSSRRFLVSTTQRIENQKDKYHFYSQTKTLGENIEALVAGFGRRGSQANLVTLMEFIKNHVFKFVVADICHMIIAKAQAGLVRDILF
ncbi:hypothetical protein METBIDRAFT_12182 [Metschnikowia bicuspidata var. bicuspidata NRRL YB-4993]|uniref:Uncharacterized protein n=1 Tax=Metschnikowia bicuspidata var. bicuspidata NRRL YB-4993 TaxID=869754 RepID=A0A1A0HCJ7_9ASCO|nr:hypothetical protein METBIDRAFT_12182 [Metschnikowia bicuspidata var. bicuspidata NRRL YB-4993]OBA21706.1 hypothetical protein METBIDRAFT_12182 [Metschnikowia bicuspidata var. bicuspidata NRRL YB-4993]